MKTTAALRGQPCGANLAGQTCGAAYPAYPAFDLRCTPLFEVLKHLEKRRTATFCLQRWPAAVRAAPFYKRKCAFLGYFGCTRKKARFGPILTYFEAIFGLQLAARGPTGQLWAPKWGSPSEPATYPKHFRCSNSQGGLIRRLRGGLFGS